MMFPPKIVVLLSASTLLAGGLIGRLTAPRGELDRDSTRAGANERIDPRGSILSLAQEDDRSRAIADVTPGKEQGDEKKIPSVAEFLRSDGFMNNYRDADRLADSLDESGVLKALALVDAAPMSSGRNSLQSALVRRLAGFNPKKAIQYVGGLKRNLRDDLYTSIAMAWGKKDSNAAKAWAMQLGDKQLKTSALRGILYSLTEKNPDQALQLALTLPQNNRYSYAYGIFEALTARNPMSAAQKALSLPSGNFRSQAISIVAGRWGQSDPAAAAKWAETLPGGRLQQNAFSNIISTWVQRDPQAAAAYALTTPAGETRANVISSLTSGWAQQDTVAAMQWVQSLPDSELKKNAVVTTLSSWAQNDPQAAANHVIEKFSGELGSFDYLQNIGYRWGEQDPEAALKWAAAQNNPAVTKNFVANIINQWANNDPEKAVSALSLIQDQAAREQASEQIARQWSNDSPEKAIAWLTTTPPGNSRDESLKTAVVNWTQNSPADVSQWLGKLPAGNTRDKLVGSFAGNVLQQDPEASAAWSSSISDPTTRKSGVNWALKSWAKNDRNGATTWVNRQNFSSGERSEFLNTINASR